MTCSEVCCGNMFLSLTLYIVYSSRRDWCGTVGRFWARQVALCLLWHVLSRGCSVSPTLDIDGVGIGFYKMDYIIDHRAVTNQKGCWQPYWNKDTIITSWKWLPKVSCCKHHDATTVWDIIKSCKLVRLQWTSFCRLNFYKLGWESWDKILLATPINYYRACFPTTKYIGV